MRIPYIDLSVTKEEYQEMIAPVLERVFAKGAYVGGEEVAVFEEHFAVYCGVKNAVAVNSGTDALILALKVLEIGHGDEVITVSNSFISTANAIEWVGAKAVFVDIGDTLLMDATVLEKAISPKTKAVIPVHLMGDVCEMNLINDLALKHGLHVIEDAAQSVGSTYYGNKTGSLGDVGCFSLHPLKNLGGIGDGGVLTTNNDHIATTLRMLRNNGLKNRDTLEMIGIVSRLDTLNAAILDDRLSRLDGVIQERILKAKSYISLLKGIDELICPKLFPHISHSFHIFVIQAEERDALKRYLTAQGIETKIHYPMLIHKQKPYSSNVCHLPQSEAAVQKILTLPLANVKMDEIEWICKKIKDFYDKKIQ